MFIWKIICPIPWKYIVSFGSYYLEEFNAFKSFDINRKGLFR